MAVKTNFNVNGNNYYKTSATIGKKTDGTRIIKVFYGKTKKDAEAAKAKFLEMLNDNIENRYEQVLFYDAFKDWLYNTKKLTIKPSTFERYEGIYRNYIINSPYANKTVDNISSNDLQAHYNNLREMGKSTSQISKLHKALSPFFIYCFQNRYIKFNPCLNVQIPKDNKINLNEVNPLNELEIRYLKNICCNDNISNMFLILLGTGLRIGELLALTKYDINFITQTIMVNKSVKKVKQFDKSGTHKYTTILQPPKTATSVRQVPFPSNLAPVLNAQLKRQQQLYNAFGEPFNDNALLFSTSVLTYLDDANTRRSWQHFLDKANIPHRGIHCLRHTYATQLFHAGVPIKTVQTLLGHSDIKVTERIYIHVMPNAKLDAVQSLNSLF